MWSRLLLGLVLVSIALAFVRHEDEGSLEEYLLQKAAEGKIMSVTLKSHVTRLDHFNLRDKRNFSLRYWENDSFFTTNKQNVILYLCGEWTCSYPSNQQYYEVIAEKHKADIFVLEHRYYGQSQPFTDWSTKNMTYLTVNQALADVAHFIQARNEEFGEVKKWVVVGGSYPGAMSAWFRYKYPHLTVGGWSSSGVVESIADFTQYDGQVRDSLFKSGEECYNTVKSLVQEVENSMPGVKQMFQADDTVRDDEFYMMLGDVFAGQIQYSNRTTFCDFITKNSRVEDLAQFAIEQGLTDTSAYTSQALSSPTIDPNKNMRQWMYQTCSELGYFQSAAAKNPTRSTWVNQTFWKGYCSRIFGQDVWLNSNYTNAEHGGNKLRVRNLIMLNGSEDPWKWTGIREEVLEDTMKPIEIVCNDCGHCRDLKAGKDGDPNALKYARIRIEVEVDKWFS